MHTHILTPQQVELLPLVKEFRKDYYLVGGTAVALYLGHRQSIDFDLFTKGKLKRKQIKRLIEQHAWPTSTILYEAYDQLHTVVNDVKMTFFQFEYPIEHQTDFKDVIQLPSLIDLGAMKAYALGGRAKWKDYVDLYLMLKTSFTLADISQRAEAIFGQFFNKKLFREQLNYFADIDRREPVEFIGDAISDAEIQAFLTEVALTPF